MKIAIVGCGKLGTKVLNALVGGDHSITVFDTQSEYISRMSQTYDIMAVDSDAKNIEVLKENGIGDFDFLLASTGNDEINMVVCALAKSLGCKKVIARVRDPEHMNQLEIIKNIMNIDFIVNPDLAITNEIYKYLVEKYTISNGIFSSDKVSMIQFNVKGVDSIIGKNMIEASKIFPGMLVVAISRKGKIIVPHGESVIQVDDTLFVIGETNEMTKLFERVSQSDINSNVQNVMVIGGGKTGFYLADKLSKYGINVKLIEIDKNRCYYLSSHLDNVLVLNGDATDQQLLDEENFGEMDAFVAATGFDEENLLLSLIAKRKGIEDVITKVSRQNYKDLVESMGIEMAINPVDIVTSNILSFIQGKERIVTQHLIQGQAEVMEVIATKDMKIVNKCLKDLALPKGLLIAAIERNEEVIIPKGDTKILAGDKVTIFYLLSEITELEKFFMTRKFFK